MEQMIKFAPPERLTNMQESIILCLHSFEKLRNYQIEGDETVQVRGRFFQESLGFAWDKHQRNLMKQLVGLGWILSVKDGHTIWYSLTALARQAKDQHFSDAVRESRSFEDNVILL